MASRRKSEDTRSGNECGQTPGAANLLVIDDDGVIRQLLDEALMSLGYTVKAVESAEHGLTSVEQDRYDLILLDLRMPGMGGSEFFRTIDQRYPELTSRVIFMTGDAASPDIRRFLKTARRPILSKPLGLDELERAVTSELNPR